MSAGTAIRDSADAVLNVTASELVRSFGLWQDRAQRSPVYVHHRGRPRLVLASIDLMSRLCAAQSAAPADVEARLAAVLDGVDALVMIVDQTPRVAMRRSPATARRSPRH